jgi:Spx/MgsR family transcriptional regulator
MIVYGIKNCDSVKKCRAYLQQKQINHVFHDYRSDGITVELVQRFLDELGAEKVLNKRGTSWRQLPEQLKQQADSDGLVDVLLGMPTLIKRPIIDDGQHLTAGFDPQRWDELG